MAVRSAYNGAERAGEPGAQPGQATSCCEIDAPQGTKAHFNFVEVHPTNVASKVEVILDQHQQSVRDHLGGRAKAMVVTES